MNSAYNWLVATTHLCVLPTMAQSSIEPSSKALPTLPLSQSSSSSVEDSRWEPPGRGRNSMVSEPVRSDLRFARDFQWLKQLVRDVVHSMFRLTPHTHTHVPATGITLGHAARYAFKRTRFEDELRLASCALKLFVTVRDVALEIGL